MEPERQILSPRLHRFTQFHSQFLPDDRDITIYLPPGYDEDPAANYPVLYMQDGQNLFDFAAPDDSFVKRRTWQMAQTADAAIAAGQVEPLLIVGIANTGHRRLAEYTPTSDWKLGGGDADKYGRLLVDELLPFIAAHYRVRPGAANTGLGGSSLGALASLYLGLKHHEFFGKLAILSPSVWWNHRAILTLVEEMAPKLGPRPRVWLDIGECEGERAIADADLLERRLRAHGWRAGTDLIYHRIPGGTHDEASWAKRVQPMLRLLFSCTSPSVDS
ncbi:MAG: alpha/beta hydrolase [Acidobacteriaceae bacterium]